MQQRTLGNSGLKVSVVGLGCNNFGGNRIDLAADSAVGWMQANGVPEGL